MSSNAKTLAKACCDVLSTSQCEECRNGKYFYGKKKKKEKTLPSDKVP